MSHEDDLRQRIEQAKQKHAPKEGGGSAGSPTQIALEFILSIVLPCFLGYHIDKAAATSPIFFVIFFFLGVATAAFMLYKHAVKDNN